MERFFIVKKSNEAYKEYFKNIEMSNILHEEFLKFISIYDFEASEYLQVAHFFGLIATESDKDRFAKAYGKRPGIALGRSSQISRDWVRICKKKKIFTPLIQWDVGVLDVYSAFPYSQKMFHIGENLYGSYDNGINRRIELLSGLSEIKGSEFYKIIEDNQFKVDVLRRIKNEIFIKKRIGF